MRRLKGWWRSTQAHQSRSHCQRHFQSPFLAMKARTHSSAQDVALKVEKLFLHQWYCLLICSTSEGTIQHKKHVKAAVLRAQSPSADAVCAEDAECVVCWAADANVLFQPCGHLCICSACAAAFKDPAVSALSNVPVPSECSSDCVTGSAAAMLSERKKLASVLVTLKAARHLFLD